MDNPGLFQESNKKYSITKRMIIFLIDGILTIGTIFALFFGICQFIIPSLAHNEISQLNSWYQEICISENVPYTEGTYGAPVSPRKGRPVHSFEAIWNPYC